MPDETFPDLDNLAGELRTKLQTRPYLLLYAYNGTGKTRLSAAFKELGKAINDEGEGAQPDTLYFNAFTEDLFSWDNDLENDRKRVLRLNGGARFFAGLAELEMDVKIGQLLERYATFNFYIDYERWEVTFFRERETNGDPVPIKVSRGEENIFVWCFFLAVLQLALDGEEAYRWVKYVYIDDPISSLDEHNAIVVANHLVQLYRESANRLPLVVSTHHHLFFNVLHYEIKGQLSRNHLAQFILSRGRTTGEYRLTALVGDTPSFHHVAALVELHEVSFEGAIHTYHFNMLRSILEKTALFHGYTHFGKCLKRDADDADGILQQRFVDLLSHGKYSMYDPVEMGEETKEHFRKILTGFLDRFQFNRELFPAPPETTPTP